MHRSADQKLTSDARTEANALRVEAEQQQVAYDHFITCRLAYQLGGDILEASGLSIVEQLDDLDLDGECVDDNPFWESVDAATWDAQDHENDLRMQQAIQDLADTFDIDRAF